MFPQWLLNVLIQGMSCFIVLVCSLVKTAVNVVG